MYPEPIQKLIDLFARFPGIGPRQAARFAFFILKEKDPFVSELRDALAAAEAQIGICSTCFRTMERPSGAISSCDICINPRREAHLIAVVEKESDMRNMEQSGAYHGLYHVLGGVISPLDQDSPKRIRLKELYERVEKRLEDAAACEVILATNPTTEGDTTARYIERVLAPLQSDHPSLTISRLGRGLSLGAELEYVDEITLKSALTNRK
ncbi:MAG: recombination protein RecR [Candidatus Sungbacteria bacterium]|nr:recombination protein RecR [Candidatus Sungbacteria bacterium]